MSTAKDWIELYHEIQTAGALGTVLTDVLARIGSPLAATDSGGRLPLAYARVEAGNRFVQVYVAALERLFLIEFWSNGVSMAGGKTPELQDLASAVHQWLSQSELRVSELAGNFPWVEAKDGAAAFEEGRAVEWKWEMLLQDEDYSEDLRALIRRAADEPSLRRLFPYTSMHTLCFSRCTGYPFTTDIPAIEPLREKEYRVCTKDGRELGSGPVESAVKLVVEHLPPHCGPARAGTAQDK